MKLIVLGSSSSGNCYILDNGNEALIIEAGIRFQEVKKALDFNLRKVVGCVVTHAHNDHAKYIKAMVDSGFHTLALREVWTAKGVWDSRSLVVKEGKGYKMGNFKVLPFPACHDVPCVGYLIDHPDMGKMVFLTDSCMCEYQFKGLNHVLIECNYSDKKLIEAITAGRTLPHSVNVCLPHTWSLLRARVFWKQTTYPMFRKSCFYTFPRIIAMSLISYRKWKGIRGKWFMRQSRV